MSHDRARMATLVRAMAGRRVVVVGDVILDEYLVGRPSRLSREAPVAVLEFQHRFCRPGGAANPAVNVRALGSAATLIAVVGDDQAAKTLKAELKRAGLGGDGLVAQAARTAVKTRLLAQNNANQQHVARLDYLAPCPSPGARRALFDRLCTAAALADAVLVSDYKGGVIESEIVGQLRAIGRERALLTCVDSQGDLALFGGLDLLKCNLAEAEAALSRRLDSDAEIMRGGEELLAKLNARYFVLTRGADGLSVFQRGHAPIHVPPANRTEVFDVTGAGDTVIAVLTLSLIAGATLAEAAHLANIAAGLVVRRLGVATVTPAELLAAVSQ